GKLASEERYVRRPPSNFDRRQHRARDLRDRVSGRARHRRRQKHSRITQVCRPPPWAARNRRARKPGGTTMKRKRKFHLPPTPDFLRVVANREARRSAATGFKVRTLRKFAGRAPADRNATAR